MADLAMGQIPSFSLGAQPPNITGMAQQAQQGMQNGATNAIQAAQFQQQLAQQKHQQDVEKNLKMMELGTNIVLEGGDDALPTGQQLIRQAYPFLTGQQLPPDLPIDKPMAKGMDYWTSQYRANQQDPTKGVSAKDAVFGIQQEIAHKSLKQQTAQEALLQSTPMYKEATANLEPGQVNGQSANFNPQSGQPTAQGSGQPLQGNFVPNTTLATIQNEKAQSLKSTFLESSKDFQQIAPDYRDFSTLLQPMPTDTSTMSAQDKQNAVTSQKAALLKYVQLNVPASRRPPNMGSLETMAKGGEIPQQAEQYYNQLFKTGSPLTGKQVKALRTTGLQTYLSAEAQQTQLENSWAQNAGHNGVDPQTVLQNFRPSSAVSSSPIFKGQSVPTWDKAAIGQVVPGPKGSRLYLGGDRTNSDNWAEVANNE